MKEFTSWGAYEFLPDNPDSLLNDCRSEMKFPLVGYPVVDLRGLVEDLVGTFAGL